MQIVTSTLLTLVASTASAHPYLSPGWANSIEPSNLDRGVVHHSEYPMNTTLVTRKDKGICTTLDLPTEEQYKIGYEAFCNNHIPSDQPLQIKDDDLTVTVLLKNHQGADLPWVFKVSSEKWAGATSKRTYFLSRSVCLAKFRDVSKGQNAKLGDEYCKVEGEETVLVKGGTVRDYPAGLKSTSNGAFETRKRKGKFNAEEERKKGN